MLDGRIFDAFADAAVRHPRGAIDERPNCPWLGRPRYFEHLPPAYISATTRRQRLTEGECSGHHEKSDGIDAKPAGEKSPTMDKASPATTGWSQRPNHSLATSGQPAKRAPAPAARSATRSRPVPSARHVQSTSAFFDIAAAFRSGGQAPTGMSLTSAARTIRSPRLRCFGSGGACDCPDPSRNEDCAPHGAILRDVSARSASGR